MPLRAITCPISCAPVPLPECVACAQGYLGQEDPLTGELRLCHYPAPFFTSLLDEQTRRQHAGLSASMLSGCLRKSYWDVTRDYEARPQQLMAAVSGTAWHEYMERFNEPGVIAEKRLAYRLPSGAIITGAQDRVIPVPAHKRTLSGAHAERPEYWIEDYKRKKDKRSLFTPGHPPGPYVLQLNIYRLMIEMGSQVIGPNGELTDEWVKGAVTKLTLLPGCHEDEGLRVTVSPLPLAYMMDFLEECVAIWKSDELPPQQYTHPEREPFCSDYCPHKRVCREAGGVAYHPAQTLQRRLAESE